MLSVEFAIQSHEVPTLKIVQAGGKPGIFFSLKSSALDYSAAASSPMGTLANKLQSAGIRSVDPEDVLPRELIKLKLSSTR